MKRYVLHFMCFLFIATSLHAGENIEGFWKTINEKTGKAESIIAIYPYNGLWYGRIIASYGPQGEIDDTIAQPKDRAPGVKGHPYYSGLDIIWNLQKQGTKFVNGKILDPQKGKIYDSELWNQNGDLIVRGKILFFGRNQTWIAASQQDFPHGFELPDLTQMVPTIPQVNR